MATTQQVELFNEQIHKLISARVKDAVDSTKEEARKSLNEKLDQIALDVAIDMSQSKIIEEMAEKITFEIKGSYAAKNVD